HRRDSEQGREEDGELHVGRGLDSIEELARHGERPCVEKARELRQSSRYPPFGEGSDTPLRDVVLGDGKVIPASVVRRVLRSEDGEPDLEDAQTSKGEDRR